MKLNNMSMNYTNLETSKLIQSKVPNIKYESWRDEEDRPRIGLRLDSVLQAIKVYGEKRGWPKRADGTFEAEMSCYEAVAHGLVDAYLADGIQFGPKSEAVIKDIFK